MEILRVPVSEYDIEELACKILGLDIDEIDADTQIIEDKMAEEYYIDLDTFRRIIERLLPLIDVGTSGLTGERFKGFADVANKCWLVKTEVSA